MAREDFSRGRKTKLVPPLRIDILHVDTCMLYLAVCSVAVTINTVNGLVVLMSRFWRSVKLRDLRAGDVNSRVATNDQRNLIVTHTALA
jgi:hypothetical protein